MILLLPWIPFTAAVLVLAVPRSRTDLVRKIAITACGLSFFLTLSLFFEFDIKQTGFQFVHTFAWVPSLGISYQVGLDGINIAFCLLHAFVSFAGAFVSASCQERRKEYLFYYLILTGAIYGVFTVLNLFFVYLYYELTLIPLFPMIGIWGSKNKEYGAMKLTIYITAGALLALFGILLLYHEMGATSFDWLRMMQKLAQEPIPADLQKTLAPFFLIGFGVIASLWPFHSWSPIGYAAAPTSVSMLHAGVLKKMGPYLMIRLAVMLLPEGTRHWAFWLAILAGIGILYAAYAAVSQKDLKFMIGFSSVSHMGYVLLGIAAMNTTALSGAIFLMFSHGVMAACAFALIGFLYEQTHYRGVTDFGGLGQKAPFWATCFVMTALASAGVPGFSNFASELLVFIGAWSQYPVIVSLAVFGILITALYLFRTVQSVCYGPFNPRWQKLEDVSGMVERVPFILLLAALLVFGLWPQGLLKVISPTVQLIFHVTPAFTGALP